MDGVLAWVDLVGDPWVGALLPFFFVAVQARFWYLNIFYVCFLNWNIFKRLFPLLAMRRNSVLGISFSFLQGEITIPNSPHITSSILPFQLVRFYEGIGEWSKMQV